MNANEVIAHLASAGSALNVHPNDHVNMSQSSNDVIPTAIHLSALLATHEQLMPALVHLSAVIGKRAVELGAIVKTGRTHLMDAMPLTLEQELGGWRAQIDHSIERILASQPRLRRPRWAARPWERASTQIRSSPRKLRQLLRKRPA